MKKFLKLSLFAMLMLAILAACGEDGTTTDDPVDDDYDDQVEEVDNGDENGEEPDDDGEVAEGFDWRAYDGETITIGIWWGNETEEESLRAVIESFTELTGIDVEPRTYEDYQTQLLTELAGGTAPDVFYVEAMLAPTFIDQGVLANLDSFIADTPEFNSDDFFSPALDAFSDDGNIYGLPKDLSTLGLLYNERLLEEAGFTPEDIPTVMSELPDFLRELDDALPDDVTAAVTSSELARHMFALQAGGTNIVDEDGNVSLAGADQLDYLEMHVELFQDGIIQRADDLGAGWSGDAFGLEYVALMIEGNWVLGHLANNFGDVEFGTMELPTMNGQNASMMYTVAWGINAGSDNLGAAWLFTNYLTSTEGMAAWAEPVGVIPSRSSSTDVLDLNNNETLEPFVAAANYATPWQNGVELPIIMDEYNNLFPAVLAGDMTLSEAMEEAESRANSEIDIHLR